MKTSKNNCEKFGQKAVSKRILSEQAATQQSIAKAQADQERIFNSFIYTALLNTKIDYIRELNRRKETDVPFTSNMSSRDELMTAHHDIDPFEIGEFEVAGYHVVVHNGYLVSALKDLSEIDRSIILLVYFVGFSIRESATLLQIAKSTAIYRRKRTIVQMRKRIGGA